MSHRSKGCDGGKWRCDWCNCKAFETTGKSPGPKGSATLCAICASRHRSGHTGPPTTTADGRFLCEKCGTTFASLRGLGSHRRGCTGGKWRCEWCNCAESRSRGKSPGPKGSGTLCSACGSRFRSGHTGPPRKDSTGYYVCEECNSRYRSIGALGGHRRFCLSLSRTGGQLFEDSGLPTWSVKSASGGAVVALPASTNFASAIPRELVGQALEAWDLFAVCSTEIFETKVGLGWAQFEALIVHPERVVAALSFQNLFVIPITLIMEDLRNGKIDGRKQTDQIGIVAEARRQWPLNALTWQAHLVNAIVIRAKRHMRKMFGGEMPSLDDPLVRSDPFLLGMNKLTKALLENEFETLSITNRIKVFQLLAELLLDTAVVRDYFKKVQRQITEHGISKRQEYGAALKAAEKEATAPSLVKGACKAGSKPGSPSVSSAGAAGVASPAAAAASAVPASAADVPSPSGGGVTAAAAAKKGAAVVLVRKRGDLDEVRKAEVEARKKIDTKYNALRKSIGNVRGVELGKDRDNRAYWIMGGDYSIVFVRSPNGVAPKSWLREDVESTGLGRTRGATWKEV